jgi:hypothetical protein
MGEGNHYIMEITELYGSSKKSVFKELVVSIVGGLMVFASIYIFILLAAILQPVN